MTALCERRWSELVDLPLLLSQTKDSWSLAPVDTDVDSATYDMVAQCGAGGYELNEDLNQEKKVLAKSYRTLSMGSSFCSRKQKF